MTEDKEKELIVLMNQFLEEQKKTNRLLSDMVDLFKKYEIDEVLYSEELRED